jgi:hypothetical protein
LRKRLLNRAFGCLWACKCVCGLVLWFSPVYGQGYESNHQFVEGTLRQAARRAVSSLDSLSNIPVMVAHRPFEQESIERLLYQKVIELLLAEQLPVVSSANADSSANAVRFNFKIIAFDLKYLKLPAGWFRSGRIRRAAQAVIDFDIQNAATGTIYFQDLVAEARTDTLPAQLKGQIETPELPYTIGSWEESSGGKSIWEPLLLAAATGAVIYAFYSLRSH